MERSFHFWVSSAFCGAVWAQAKPVTAAAAVAAPSTRRRRVFFMAQHSPDAWWRIRLSDGHTGYDPGVHEREGMDSDAPPPPGPLAAVDMSHPRAAAVMSSVRNRVATWGDQGIALRRANDAAETVLRLLEGDPACMGRGMHTVPGAVARVHELPQERPLWIIGDVRGDAVALATALAFVDEADGEGDAAFVAFLGDWAGGFHGDAASAAMVLERFATHPERTLMVRGDREWCLDAMEAVRIDGSAHPAGLLDMPVDEALAPTLRELASRVARVAHLMPCAVLLPDGVMLAHGALPRPARLQAHQSGGGPIQDRNQGRGSNQFRGSEPGKHGPPPLSSYLKRATLPPPAAKATQARGTVSRTGRPSRWRRR
jgi:hypothetical protein